MGGERGRREGRGFVLRCGTSFLRTACSGRAPCVSPRYATSKPEAPIPRFLTPDPYCLPLPTLKPGSMRSEECECATRLRLRMQAGKNLLPVVHQPVVLSAFAPLPRSRPVS